MDAQWPKLDSQLDPLWSDLLLQQHVSRDDWKRRDMLYGATADPASPRATGVNAPPPSPKFDAVYNNLVVPLFEEDFAALHKECASSSKSISGLQGVLSTMAESCDANQRDQIRQLNAISEDAKKLD